MEGWISLHRKIQENDLWLCEPFTRGQAWIDLLLLANHEPGYFYKRGVKIDLKIGQVGWSELALSIRWKWSRNKVRKFLNDLEKEHQIKQQKTNVTQVLTLLNYEKYQKKDTKQNTKRTTEGQQKDTNNNDNNDNNIKERERIFHDEVLKYKDDYSHEMLKSFFLYWSEPNKSKTKMRYESEKTWEISRRLRTWFNRSRK
jgi:hypothetical protein